MMGDRFDDFKEGFLPPDDIYRSLGELFSFFVFSFIVFVGGGSLVALGIYIFTLLF